MPSFPPVLVDRAQEDEDLEVDGEKDVLSPTEETLDHHRCWRLGECDLGSDGSAFGGEAVLGESQRSKIREQRGQTTLNRGEKDKVVTTIAECFSRDPIL